MLGLLNRLRAWIGLPNPRPAIFTNRDRSDSMSAMPHARQVEMEHVLESLSLAKQAADAPQIEVHPAWRLVSRDGSTSSVGRPQQPAAKRDCPDCRAGRCGENPEGCDCAKSAELSKISLNQLTETHSGSGKPSAKQGAGIGASMPQPKPQLFDDATGHTLPTGLLESMQAEQVRSFRPVDRAAANNAEAARESAAEIDPPAPDVRIAATPDRHDADLQRVIDRWPQLPRNARQAILALLAAATDVDSA